MNSLMDRIMYALFILTSFAIFAIVAFIFIFLYLALRKEGIL